MKKLTNKEQEPLKILWRLEKAFVKEIQADLRQNRLITTPYPPLFATSKTKVMLLIKHTETHTPILPFDF